MTWPYTNQAVQPQKMARELKFPILREDGLHYWCSENKGANQLRGYCIFVFAYAKKRFSYNEALILDAILVYGLLVLYLLMFSHIKLYDTCT